MQQCPICEGKKVWKYGVRVTTSGEKRRLLCRNCGHLWEISEDDVTHEQNDVLKETRVPTELRSYFVEMMRQIVDDIQRGIEPTKAGWCSFPDEVQKRLIRTGLCENAKEGIRLVISSKYLPRELARTDEGDIISDIQKALKLKELLSKLATNHELCIGSEYFGLLRMLQTSDFPILATLLFEKGLNANIWFAEAPATAEDLTSTLAKELWGIERLEKARLALSNFGAPIIETDAQPCEHSGKIKEILKWDMVCEVFEHEILESLGFLWYVDFLIGHEEIKYLESIRIVQKSTWEILETLTGKKNQDLEIELLEAIKEIEKNTMIERGEEKSNRTNWHEVIRIPW